MRYYTLSIDAIIVFFWSFFPNLLFSLILWLGGNAESSPCPTGKVELIYFASLYAVLSLLNVSRGLAAPRERIVSRSTFLIAVIAVIVSLLAIHKLSGPDKQQIDSCKSLYLEHLYIDHTPEKFMLLIINLMVYVLSWSWFSIVEYIRHTHISFK